MSQNSKKGYKVSNAFDVCGNQFLSCICPLDSITGEQFIMLTFARSHG